MTFSRESSVAIVDTYLQLCEERKLKEATALWVAGAMDMEFPGPKRFTSLDELVASSRTQYQWVRKNRDEYAMEPGGGSVVVSIGRLYGVNIHGIPFHDVRYVDVFTFSGSLISRQRVWNDLAASGVLAATH